MSQGQKVAEALSRLWLQEYGAAYVDDINPNLGNLGDVALLYAAIYAYLYFGLGTAEFRYLFQDFGYELAAVETRVNGQKEYTVHLGNQRKDSGDASFRVNG